MTSHRTINRSPLRRTHAIVERALDDEVLVHDADADRIVALDVQVAAVWRLCDGSRSIEDIAAQTGQPLNEVAGRLATLDDAQLLESRGMSRRALLTRAGVVGLAVPVVSMLNLPAAAAANSVLSQTSTFTCSAGGGDNRPLNVATNMTGGLANTYYSLFIYTNSALTALAGSDTNNRTNGAGAVSFAVQITNSQLPRGSTLYFKVTQGQNSTTTDTVFQVVIPLTTGTSCTAPPA
ncbi:MAG TPA: hypothetical protein VMH41_09430 [Mycobacteriales bacterium]|nr:hypothetical protein [Mycobacteriales bacterium]